MCGRRAQTGRDVVRTIPLVFIKEERVGESGSVDVRSAIDFESWGCGCRDRSADTDCVRASGHEIIEIQCVHVGIASAPGAEARSNRIGSEHRGAAQVLDDECCAGFCA